MNKFYIFGSEDSQDFDVFVEVDEVPKNISIAHDICKLFNNSLSTLLPNKVLNCNIGVIENGFVIDCFKGTADELNNCIYYTYNNHKQFYPNPIYSLVERDIEEKLLRVARFIITFYSRTDLRSEIKAALRGSLKLKLEVLKKINFETMCDFPDKKEKKEDIKKTIAFQFGQVFSLMEGYESDSYTKNGVIKNYPDLKNFLHRNAEHDLNILNKYLNHFIVLLTSRIENMRLFEVGI